MNVLIYGSFVAPGNWNADNCEFVCCFAKAVLRRGHRLVTREGAARPEEVIPVDNLVLAGAQSLFAASGISPVGRLTTICDPARYDGRYDTDVPRAVVRAPQRGRLKFYGLLLSHSDAIVTFGGGRGVLRLGLVSHFLHKPLIPVAVTGGTSQDLWQDLDADVEARRTGSLSLDDYLWLGSRASNESPEMRAEHLLDIVERSTAASVAVAVPPTLQIERLRPVDIVSSMTVPQWVAVVSAALTVLGAVYYLGLIDLFHVLG